MLNRFWRTDATVWKRRWVLILCVPFLSGCALTAWSQLKKAEYKDAARDFTATIPVGWMRFNLADYFLITRDGTVLDRIAVARQKNNAKLEATKKVFTKDMTPQELAEVEIDNLNSGDAIGKVQILSNKPATVGGQEGFRVEYTYVVTDGGLRVRGIHYGFRHKNWVYRVFYEASAQHYFDAYRKDFDGFIESFRILEK